MSTPVYRIDSPIDAFRNLADLVDLIADLYFEGIEDETVRSRVSSLIWVARDLSDGIRTHYDDETAQSIKQMREKAALDAANRRACVNLRDGNGGSQ